MQCVHVFGRVMRVCQMFRYFGACLRHTAITIAIESGVEITRVSRFARHRNLNTTMVYIHDNKRSSDPVAGYVEAAVNGERTSKDEEAIEKIVRNVLRRLLKL